MDSDEDVSLSLTIVDPESQADLHTQGGPMDDDFMECVDFDAVCGESLHQDIINASDEIMCAACHSQEQAQDEHEIRIHREACLTLIDLSIAAHVECRAIEWHQINNRLAAGHRRPYGL